MKLTRLTSTDQNIAKTLFTMMANVFEEECEELSNAYVDGMLTREDFWAIAAFEGEKVVGGLTAFTLPLTRLEMLEIFIYDLAVHADFQRRGIGRQLVEKLRELAAAEGIDVVFVPAENEDRHALDFYRAIGGEESPVTFFTFERS